MGGNPYYECIPAIAEECEKDGDCPGSLACINRKCIDPCTLPGICSGDQRCSVTPTLPLRTIVCTCPEDTITTSGGNCVPIGKYYVHLNHFWIWKYYYWHYNYMEPPQKFVIKQFSYGNWIWDHFWLYKTDCNFFVSEETIKHLIGLIYSIHVCDAHISLWSYQTNFRLAINSIIIKHLLKLTNLVFHSVLFIVWYLSK